jgi:hypothetical protein
MMLSAPDCDRLAKSARRSTMRRRISLPGAARAAWVVKASGIERAGTTLANGADCILRAIRHNVFWRVSSFVEALAARARNHPALALLLLTAIGIGVAPWFLQMTP